MALNIIWISFFVLGFIAALIKLTFFGNTEIFKTIVDGIFATANTSVEVAIGLIGVMSLFLGIMNVGERAGAIGFLARIVGPFFARLFPDLPKNHPAMGHMMMNFSANLLGLDNAATPFGLKAMQSLQDVNPDKETASNPQIMFMVLHASGLTLIPVSIIAQRIIAGSKDPTSIFIPCMIATFVATVVAMMVVAIKQRINLFQPVIMLWIGGITLLLALMIFYFKNYMTKEGVGHFSRIFSNGIILLIFFVFILGALRKKIDVFGSFIEGAKQGFEIAVKIIPYLVAMLVAISVFRTSGVFDYVLQGISWFFAALGFNTDFVPALPVALMKPLSGSGARGMMIEIIQGPHGPDSFVGQLACIFNGTADTTFYIVALYFGSVGIKRTRYAVPAALLADLAGIIASIMLAYFFFH
ncbi:MAG TPA: nucleoside recognition domain-containing protein [Chitinophagaceae bacterium]|nr:nucleoside recognition domain-containing protein [Chitinophagaceae bacterium]